MRIAPFQVACLALLLISAARVNAAPAVPGSCESLASMTLPNVTITKAEAVAAGGLNLAVPRGSVHNQR